MTQMAQDLGSDPACHLPPRQPATIPTDPSPKSVVTQLQELICFDLSFSSSFKKFQENSHFAFLRLLE